MRHHAHIIVTLVALLGCSAPAPRTSGPDGRNEGTLQIDLPT